MVAFDRALVSFYKLSVVSLSLSATVWPQFATQVFHRGPGSLHYISSCVNN